MRLQDPAHFARHPLFNKFKTGWCGYYAPAVEIKLVPLFSDPGLVEPAGYRVADPLVGCIVFLACTHCQRAAAKAEYMFITTTSVRSVVNDGLVSNP